MRKKLLMIGWLFLLFVVVSACSNDESTEETNPSAKEMETENDTETSDPRSEPTDREAGLVASGDTVSEDEGCVLASRFRVGEKIVFRMDAIDPSTNEQVVDAKLQVHLSTGEVLDMVYAQHPPGVEKAPKFWTAAYVVSEDTPTGILDYYVTAEAGDRTAEFRPFNVQPSLLTIVDGESLEPAPTEGQPDGDESAEPVAEISQTIDMAASNFKFDQSQYHVKAGEEVTIHLSSEDGIHGINIDAFDVSIEAPEGTATFTPNEPGEYEIYCNTFCGEGHAKMKATLIVS